MGNITAMTADPPLKTSTDTFSYDKVSRLTSATVQGYGSESYQYDPYGNLTQYGTRPLPADTATNRLSSGASYDAAGNMIGWTIGSDTYTAGYDDFNRLVSLTGGGLNRAIAYTASGERILVRDGTTSTMVTLRDLSGNVLRELTYANGAWRWQKDYIYRGGLLLASVGGATDSTTGRWEGIHHYHLDQLGSPRLVTNRSGERLKELIANPFGVDPDGGTQDVERMRFTIHERDLGSRESKSDDVDYMITRAYAPFLGRFTSADSLRGHPDSPQTLNLYAYVAGNPVSRGDPSGMDFWSWLRGLFKWIDPSRNPDSSMPRYNGSTTVTAHPDPVATVPIGGMGGSPAPAVTPLAGRQDGADSPRVGKGQRVCVGVVKFSAVGPLPQAAGQGALAPYGAKPEFGTVAADPGVFGLPYDDANRVQSQQLLGQAGHDISIWPIGLNFTGGPRPPYSVGDVGDVNIRGSGTPRFDIYRFSSKASARGFGIQTVKTVILLPENLTCAGQGLSEVR